MMFEYLRPRNDLSTTSVRRLFVPENTTLMSGSFSTPCCSAVAPEFALSEQIVTASDLYSLGCIIYAVHAKVRRPS
jgi:hypothetical protein